MEKKFFDKDAAHVSSVALLVKDLNNMLDFYENYLGLTVIDHSEKHAYLSANGKDVLLELHTNDNVLPKQNNWGLYHFALLFEDQKALADVFLNIAKKEYAFTGFSDHGVSEAIYLKDPEGNDIELYHDRPQADWPLDQNGNMTMFTDYLDYNKYLIIASEDFEKINPNTIMGHLHLYVNGLKKADEFFINTLNYELQLNYGGAANFTSYKKYHHHIAYNTWLRGASYRPENGAGMLGYTITISEENFNKIVENVKNKNIEFAYNRKNQPTVRDVNNCVVAFNVIK